MKKKILYCQYTNPAAYPPLEHSAKIFAEQEWEILFLGVESYGESNVLKLTPHPYMQCHLLKSHLTGWRQKIHYGIFILWIIKWVIISRPSWFYASDYYSCPVAFLLSYVFQISIIYHEHDSAPINNHGVINKLFTWMRKKLAQRAQINILPNEARVHNFIKQLDICDNKKKSVMTVLNCPNVDEIGTMRSQYYSNNLWLLYHGSLVPERLPQSVLYAISLLPKIVKLRLIGYETIGSQGYKNTLLKTARDLGISDQIIIMDAIPFRKNLLEICQTCDIGLSLMPKISDDMNIQMMTGASNKPFDYLSRGLALLVSDLSTWQQMFVEPGFALACDPDNPHSIAKALQWYLDHPSEMRKMGERGRQQIELSWNYEKQFSPILSHINQS